MAVENDSATGLVLEAVCCGCGSSRPITVLERNVPGDPEDEISMKHPCEQCGSVYHQNIMELLSTVDNPESSFNAVTLSFSE